MSSYRGVTLLDEASADIPTIAGDQDRLAQALDNLISNAVKFTPAGGTVAVSVQALPDPGGISIAVKDTGRGIPSDELDSLFTQFFRSSVSTRYAIPGVGLGLVITKAIVDAHGGQMSVDSTEGVGSTFTMTLPITHTESPGVTASTEV